MILMLTEPTHPKSEDVIVRAVLRLARRMRQTDDELTGGALGLLLALYREGPMSAVALAREQGLQPQSLSRLLLRLATSGLIARSVDSADGRRHVIAITPQGRTAMGRSMACRRAWLADAMTARLDKKERAVLLRAADLMLRMAA